MSFQDYTILLTFTSVAANPEILSLKTVVDEWTGLPKINEREAARADSLVGGQGKNLGCKCKKVTVRQRGVLVMPTN